MKLKEIICSSDLSSERGVEKLLALFVQRRTIINREIDICVCQHIEDYNLKQYYLGRSIIVAKTIKELPVIKKKNKAVKLKNNKVTLDRGGIADDGPIRKMRSLKLQEQAEISQGEKYEYGLSDW